MRFTPSRRSFRRLGPWLIAAAIGLAVFPHASAQELRVLPDELLGKYDVNQHMVAVEALVVEVNEERTRDLGLHYGVNTLDSAGNARSSVLDGADVQLGPTFTPVRVPVLIKGLEGFTDIKNFDQTPSSLPGLGISLVGMNVGMANISASLRALLDAGDASIRTRPIGVALNGTPVLIEAVDEIPFQNVEKSGDALSISVEKVGVKLNVTPKILSLRGGVVRLQIDNIEVSSVSSFITTKNVDRPVFSKSSTQTKVTLAQGETFVIGGLKTRRSMHSEERVPILGAIPLLGLLFTSQEDLERNMDVLFFITPYILRPGQNFAVPYDFKHKQALGFAAQTNTPR